MTTQDATDTSWVTSLAPRLARAKGFADVLDALRAGNSAAIDGAWGSSCALSVAALAESAPSTVVVVLPRVGDVDEFAADLQSFTGSAPLVFPAWESLPQEKNVSDVIFGGRLRVLRVLDEATPPAVIVTSLPALLQPVPSRHEREAGTRTLAVGDEIDLDEFLHWLIERGFDRVTGLQMPGEFSMHGGIVDVFPPDALDPIRIEFFGDEIESIREFDVETQRKVCDLQTVALTLVAPVAATDARSAESSAGHFVDSLSESAWVGLVELAELVEEGRHYLARLESTEGLFGLEETLARCIDRPTCTLATIAADSMEQTCHLQVESIERFARPRNEVLDELDTIVSGDERVLIACHNEGELERLGELFDESSLGVSERIELCVGRVAHGFRLVQQRLIVIGDNELFGRADVHRGVRRRRRDGRAIDSFLDLDPGDLVVHLTNGIGRYRGMKLLEKEGQSEEHLVIEFRDNLRVYVPVSLIHLVQKYIGGAKGAPQLSKLGTATWNRKKERVAQAVSDLASDMLQMQAARELKPGLACEPDSHWMQEFEASFPYTATPDQVDAIHDFKEDMERSRPMDRLICGDVGYGKTEVAMRSAFKAIEAGRQVAVLVPTTVLAEQHFRTFGERMAEYPISIASLSRFKSARETRLTLEGMVSGGIDLVIGTHRLIQKDIAFKDLGLLVIDEEQRFGVAAKEMLKQLRLEVDVLTLSATPIPRTLHMALLGIRDISNLETPPQDRTAVATRVCRFDADLIRQAIVRELNRNGQVFFVHNRVYNIKTIADRLQRIVPEATIDIVHGQMHGDELEAAMVRFVNRESDILVCTTIIESGLDIPNANTIFIHEADRYGLADLHQLRGRVGRYKNRAYCYLLLEEGRVLTQVAAKRVKAIEEFSELGAGFKIAMRDLEIRGAGNILGTEQSGHIVSVGYELYCTLLENAVRRQKNEPVREHKHVAVDLPLDAFFPDAYIPPGKHKIEAYRKLSNIQSVRDYEEFETELRDRFGHIPPAAAQLLEVKQLQLLAMHWGIEDIRLEGRFAVFGYRDASSIRRLAKMAGDDLRIVDGESAYLVLDDPSQPGEVLLGELKAVLQPN